MKYLKTYESFSDNLIYHISPIENRENILNNGLLISSKKRYNNISENAIYCWQELKMALWYALTESMDFNKTFDIWEIKSDKLEIYEDTSIGLPYAIKIKQNIKSDNIILKDTIEPYDKRIKKYSDVDDVINEIEDDNF